MPPTQKTAPASCRSAAGLAQLAVIPVPPASTQPPAQVGLEHFLPFLAHPDHPRHVPHLGTSPQPPFHLPGLHHISSDLHLLVRAPLKIQASILAEPPQVSCSVSPILLGKT